MKEENRSEQTRFTFRERFRYWFDNRMTKGSLGLIRVLIIASVLLAVLVALLIISCGFAEEGDEAAVIWDSIATVINAWMPSFEDGTPGYILLMAVVAIAGVLFTSVLIGIITSAIEEKIDELKKGNSRVIESGHIVVLGFYPGEYTLIRQLILAAAGKPACIVVAEDMEREEIEQDISENIDVPKNFRIVCRTVDITSPASIEKCSVETSHTVIVSPTDDARTMKAILAVSAILQEKGAADIRINAIVSKSSYSIRPSVAAAHNITTLKTHDILAKMMAHSCTQVGLSGTFREVFDFDGSEFYLMDFDGIAGITFEELAARTEGGTPAGILSEAGIELNPEPGRRIGEGERILVFAPDKDSVHVGPAVPLNKLSVSDKPPVPAEDEADTIIIGHNETLPTILRELPENVTHVVLAGQETDEEEKTALAAAAKQRGIELEYYDGDVSDEAVQTELAKTAEHIVILNDHDKDEDEADMETIFRLLDLRDIRSRLGLSFNITVEMRLEKSEELVGQGESTDFLVSSNMSSLILAQLAENPELVDVFREILSNKGNELLLQNAGDLRLTGRYSVRDLRRIMLRYGFVLLGRLDAQNNSSFNLPLDAILELTGEDSLIVLGETA
ncbi:MAG: hypothetical protein J6X17_00235 [Lachnospiraceae bacterium]|nr:hypothetical protein [Lachnospiraceae bacterium]